MAAYTTSNVAAVYKKAYSGRQFGDLAERNHPFMKMLAKEAAFTGSDFNYAIRYGNPQSISADFSTAQTAGGTANQGHSMWKQLSASVVTKYGVTTLDGVAMAKAGDNVGSFVRLVKDALDGLAEEHGDHIAFELYRDASGARGVVGSGYSSGTEITLATADDARNFKVGMVIKADDTATGASPRAGSTFVTAVDEDAGIITVDDDTDITSLTAGDYLFASGDQATAIEGLAKHIPLTAPTSGDSFRGISRFADTRRLAGVRVDDTSTNPEENAGLVAVKIAQIGQKANVLLLNPINFWAVARRRDAKISYDGGGMKAAIGFEGFDVHTPAGTVRAISDPDCPSNRGYVLNMDTWYYKHLKPFVHIIDDGTGGPQLTVYNADAIEVRSRSMGNLMCTKPGANGVFSI